MRRRALLTTVGALAGGAVAGCSGPPAPTGDALVSERETGRVLRVPAAGGTPTEVMRIRDVAADDSSEGGLLGIAVCPGYASDGLVDLGVTGGMV